MAYQATNNRTMSSANAYVYHKNGMQHNLHKVGIRTTNPRNSKIRLCIEINNKDDFIKKLENKIVSSSTIILIRNDIEPNCYQCDNIQHLMDLVYDIGKKDRKDHEDMLRREREKNINHEEQQETQNKKQKTTHKEATNKVSIEFTMSEPAIFTTGKVTVKTAGTKRTIYPQQKN
jgi:hypothetical protein